MHSDRERKPKPRLSTGRIRRRGATTARRIAELPGGARVIVIEGPARGSKFTVEDGMTFGRGRSATVFLDAADISREHARINLGARPAVEDLGSRNGTFVNGIPVAGPTPLRFGDRIRMGAGTILMFTHFDPAEEELRQRQRLGLLGRIAAGVAHDVNNLLGVILSTQEFLLQTPPDTPLGDPETRECLVEVRAAAERAAHLMPKLLGMSRGQSEGFGPFDISAECEEVCQVVRRTFDRRITVDTAITPGLTVVGDRVEIHHVIMNLCVNARDAMGDGGTLRLRVTEKDKRAVIEVEDTGDGMDEVTMAQAFEPFFTTKERGRGSGLGLATAREMVSLHGGEITVQSRMGDGTVFRIELPLKAGSNRIETMTVVPSIGGDSRRAHILLVDDDPMCRKAFRRLVEHAGHRVDVAEGGAEALRILRDAPLAPDLVLLDVDMPGMSGEETQRRMRMMARQLTIVAITGNRSPERQQAMLDGGAVALVPKPFTQEQLLVAIRSALALQPRVPERAAMTLRGDVMRGDVVRGDGVRKRPTPVS